MHFAAAAVLLLVGCVAGPAPAPGTQPAVKFPNEASDEAVRPRRTPDGVADLPYAQGRVFRTLDDYLAHLRRLGTMDYPYWEEVAPDRYRKVTGRRPPGAPPPEEATRAALEALYGFR